MRFFNSDSVIQIQLCVKLSLEATMKQQLMQFSCATVVLENRECNDIKCLNTAI